jgi:hypothetical protein
MAGKSLGCACRHATAAWLLLVASILGCGGSDERAEKATTAKVLSCGTYQVTGADGTMGTRQEWYALPAINRKLRFYPEFATAIGIDHVSDCAGARAYIEAEAIYADSHPGFDLDFPIEPPPAPPAVRHGAKPELSTPQIMGGVAGRNAPIVQLVTTETDGSFQSCTGTFIAKNWIATAGHCMVVGDNPMQINDSSAPDTLFAWYPYQIAWFDLSGNPIPVNGSTTSFSDVAGSLKTFALQYVDPRYEGPGVGVQMPGEFQWAKSSPKFPHGAFDFALLYLNKDDNDPVLPPNANDGSSMRISGDPRPGPSDRFYGAGCTGSGAPCGFPPSNPLVFPLKSGSNAELAPFQVVLPDFVKITIPQNFTGTTVCHGDSGGPITRSFLVAHDNGPPTLEQALVGVLSTFNTSGSCAVNAGTDVFWVSVVDEFVWINEAMEQWNGQQFTCKGMSEVNSVSIDFLQCWGSPCQSDCDCDMANGEFCSRSGQALNAGIAIQGNGSCPICGTANASCDCVVGQCLQGPPGFISPVICPPLGP